MCVCAQVSEVRIIWTGVGGWVSGWVGEWVGGGGGGVKVFRHGSSMHGESDICEASNI